MQSSLKLSCYRQSITLFSIVIPNYWNGYFSMIAGFQSLLPYNYGIVQLILQPQAYILLL